MRDGSSPMFEELRRRGGKPGRRIGLIPSGEEGAAELRGFETRPPLIPIGDGDGDREFCEATGDSLKTMRVFSSNTYLALGDSTFVI